MMLVAKSRLVFVFTVIIVLVQSQRLRNNRRQDTINEVIQRIRQQSPKTRSISPSWNGKSPYKVIGVSALPLQNEADLRSYLPQKKSSSEARSSLYHRGQQKQQQQQQQQQHEQQQKQLFKDTFSNRPSKPLTSSGPGAAATHKRQERPSRPYSQRGSGEATFRGSRPNHASQQQFVDDFPQQQQQQRFQRGRNNRPLLSGGGGVQRRRQQQFQNNLRQKQFQKSQQQASLYEQQQQQQQQQQQKKQQQQQQQFSSPAVPSQRRPQQHHERKPFSDHPMRAAPPQVPDYGDYDEDFEEQIEIDYPRKRSDMESLDPFNTPRNRKKQQKKKVKVTLTPEHENIKFDMDDRPLTEQFSSFGPNPFKNQEADDFPVQSFEGPVRVKPSFVGVPRRPHRPLPTHPPAHTHAPHKPFPLDLVDNLANVAGAGPSGPFGNMRDIPRQNRPQQSAPRKRLNPFDSRPEQPPPMFENSRPKFRPNDLQPIRNKKRPPIFPGGDEIQHGFKPNFRPNSEYPQFEDEQEPPSFKLFNENESPLNSGPVVDMDKPSYRPRTTTPRPIPTPGPNDFPRPPPNRRPRPPPTHPTHPPMITHPPAHFQRPVFEDDEDDESYYQRPGPSPGIGGHALPGAGGHTLSVAGDNPFQSQDRSDPFSSHDDDADDNNGFYQKPDGFPSFGSLFPPFESLKLRNKRSAEPEPMPLDMEMQERRFRRQRQRTPPVAARRLSAQEQYGQRYRSRQDEFRGFHKPDFWEESEDEFFRPPFGQRFNANHNNQRYRQEQAPAPRNQPQQYRQEPLREREPERPREVQRHPVGYRPSYRDPYPQSSVQHNPGSEYSRNGYNEDLQKDNEILGSGNFEVIKGGTFYDSDTYYNARGNTKPQNYYGGDFFDNFRDFQDIKSDLQYNNQPKRYY